MNIDLMNDPPAVIPGESAHAEVRIPFDTVDFFLNDARRVTDDVGFGILLEKKLRKSGYTLESIKTTEKDRDAREYVAYVEVV